MKKRVSIILALVLMLQMTACGKAAGEEALKTEPKEEVKQEMTADQEDESVATDQKSEEEISEEKDQDIAAAAGEKDQVADKKFPIGSLDSTDWKDLKFSLEGTVFTIPFDYSLIKDSWTVDLADYGYEDGYSMNAGDKTFGTIELENDKYDVKTTVGFLNDSDQQKDILDCQIWSFSMSKVYADTYPDIELPGGIVWGSTVEDVEAAYGKPEDDPYRSDELGYWSYEYVYDYSDKLRLTIYDDGGLSEFVYQKY